MISEAASLFTVKRGTQQFNALLGAQNMLLRRLNRAMQASASTLLCSTGQLIVRRWLYAGLCIADVWLLQNFETAPVAESQSRLNGEVGVLLATRFGQEGRPHL